MHAHAISSGSGSGSGWGSGSGSCSGWGSGRRVKLLPAASCLVGSQENLMPSCSRSEVIVMPLAEAEHTPVEFCRSAISVLNAVHCSIGQQAAASAAGAEAGQTAVAEAPAARLRSRLHPAWNWKSTPSCRPMLRAALRIISTSWPVKEAAGSREAAGGGSREAALALYVGHSRARGMQAARRSCLPPATCHSSCLLACLVLWRWRSCRWRWAPSPPRKR